MLKKLEFAPGVNRETTNYAAEGTWWDCDKARWRWGHPEKIGGWGPYTTGDFEFVGVCRLLTTYNTNDSSNIVTISTNQKVYVEYSQQLYDITPLVAENALSTDAFTTDTGEPGLIQINDVLLETGVGEYVFISGLASAVNGVPADEINGEHRVVEVGADYFKIAITTAPTSSGDVTASVTVGYQIGIGGATYSTYNGWGAGAWSRGTWSSAADVGLGVQLRLWSVSNYGDALVFGPRGGGLYFWDYAAGAGLSQRGELIEDLGGANEVPIVQNYILVSDQSRFVITLGANDFGSSTQNPLLVRWSDQENYLEWEPRATTQAGSQTMSAGSELICAKQTRQEILIWSDTALFSMQYVGPPYVFSFSTLADNTTIMSPNAAIVVNNTAYWMGRDRFYVYTGSVNPLPCSVRSYVFDGMNKDQAWQVTCGRVDAYSEIWWFYCGEGSDQIDKYVVFNYAENAWYFGSLARTAWLGSGLQPFPLAAAYNPDEETGTLYYHEFGVDDSTTTPPTAIQSYVESADFDIDDGDRFSFVRRMLPDITFEKSTATSPKVTMQLRPRRFPGSNYQGSENPQVERVTTVPVEQYTEQVFVRVRGRQMAFRLESTDVGVMWRMGDPRIDIRQDGRK